MRGLLVGAAPYPGEPQLLAGLMRRHDLLVAVDGGGALCLRAGLVPDIAIGDFDSLGEEDMDALVSAGVEVLRFPSHKDESDLELALRMVSRRGASAVTLVGTLAGRIDHTLAVVGVVRRAEGVHVDFEEPELRGWLLTQDGRSTVSLTGDRATVSILALDDDTRVSVHGALWSDDRIELRFMDPKGLSNVIVEARMDIAVDRGAALVLSSLDELENMARLLE